MRLRSLVDRDRVMRVRGAAVGSLFGIVVEGAFLTGEHPIAGIGEEVQAVAVLVARAGL